MKSTKSKNVSYLRQKGLSLIELMIALTLGSIVTVGVVQLFVANSQTYKLLTGQSRMQESARFSHEFIGRAIRQAGYKGCYSTNREVTTTLTPSNVPYEFDLRTGIQGFDGTALGTWLPTIVNVLPQTVGTTDTKVFQTAAGDGEGNGIDGTEIIPQTDILTTRNMSGNEARLQGIMPSSNEPIDVEIPAAGNEFVEDHIAIIGDCEKATLFRITDPVTPDGAGLATIEHTIVDTDATRNMFTQLASVNTFDIDAVVAAVESHTFFIAPGAGVNNLNTEVLSLWRKSGTEKPVELVEGVENLQILYGIDTDGDRTPNQYVPANLVTDFLDVATVRVSVTVNSVDDVGARTAPTHGCVVQACISGQTYDGLIRRTFTQTIYLRNHG